MHLSDKKVYMPHYDVANRLTGYFLEHGINNIDSCIFYSVPSSFFVLDERIPKIIRDLISEAEGCLKMNYLTGASACMRKSIYELLIIEKIKEKNYDDGIKKLKAKYPDITSTYIDILSHIKDMTSDKVHEQSWDKWDSKYLKLIIEALKAVLHEIYVIPEIKKAKALEVQSLLQKVNAGKIPTSGLCPSSE